MNITKKAVAEKVEKYTPVNLTASQKALYTTVWNEVMPQGKWANKTAKWVYDNDKKYWQWLEEKGILHTWGIIRIKDSAMEPECVNKPRPFYGSDGQQWIGLREYPVPSKAYE